MNAVTDSTPQSAADLFLQQLAASGVRYFFANGGTDFPPIAEAFARAAGSNRPVPRPMVVTHENAAVAMAHGVYMVTGQPQAVMLHVNVGTANAINALLDAGRDQTPVLLFAGKTPYSEGGRHGARTRYIHWAQEMFDQAGMLREAVKWDGELRLPEQAADLVARAAQVAMTSPRGPVYATLPRDILAMPAGSATVEAGTRRAPSLPHPDPAALAEAARWIAAAERPMIVTASAGRTAEGFAALSELAERFAIPVVEFHPRFANLPGDHPLHLGFQPRPLLEEADLVLVVECDVPWIPHQEAPPENCRVVHLGEDPAFQRYPMRSFRMDLAITTEAGVGLRGLIAALEAAAPDAARLDARRATLTARATARREAARAATRPPEGAITPEWISRCIAEAVDDDAIIVNEYPLRQEHCPRRKAGTYFGLSPAGGLGWGLGAALGAKLAAPERTVVATLGDGAYVFANPTACHWVAQAHGVPVLTVVFNNALYGAVRNSTLAMYRDGLAARDGGRILAELGPSPAFETLAEASGGYGERVEQAAELPAALRRALAALAEGRQALLNVVCEY